MKALVPLLSTVLCLGTVAAVQPAPSQPQVVPESNDEATDAAGVREDVERPTADALDAIASELRAIREQAAQIEQARAERDSRPGPPIYSNWFLIIVTAGAVIAAFRTLGVLRRQVDAAAETAEAAKTSASAVMLAERAYAKMSHCPPGLQVLDRDTGECQIRMRVKNGGRTPAQVTQTHLVFHVLDRGQDIPRTPNYSLAAIAASADAVLASDGELFFTAPLHIEQAALDSVLAGAELLLVYGYVDYIDVFGVRYRAGYGRTYHPQYDIRANYSTEEDFAKRSNLVFIPRRSYNYDRPREEGEGNDWKVEHPEQPL